MNRWRVALLGLILLAAALGCWYLSASRSGPRLRVENYASVRVGMTQGEVEDLFGGPPGNYGRNLGNSMMTEEGAFKPPGSVERVWSDDHNRFEVHFDSDDRVVKHHKRAGYEQMSESWRSWIARTFGL